MPGLSMMDRIINMVHKTGDKAILFERETEEAVVVMDFNCYEKLLSPGSETDIKNLTEEELMEKINKDIAVWRANNEKSQTEIYSQALEVKKEEPANPLERPSTAQNFTNIEGENLKDIPQETADERFYLEPVE